MKDIEYAYVCHETKFWLMKGAEVNLWLASLHNHNKSVN